MNLNESERQKPRRNMQNRYFIQTYSRLRKREHLKALLGSHKGMMRVSRLGLVVRRPLDWTVNGWEGRRFDSPLRLIFLFQKCDLWTLSQ